LAQLEDLHIVQAAAIIRHSGDAYEHDRDDDDVSPTRSSSVEEVEMALLAGHERRASSSNRESLEDAYGDGLDGMAAVHDGHGADEAKMTMRVPLTREDKKAMALLIVLCAFLVFS
jgi:hypothetical protein